MLKLLFRIFFYEIIFYWKLEMRANNKRMLTRRPEGVSDYICVGDFRSYISQAPGALRHADISLTQVSCYHWYILVKDEYGADSTKNLTLMKIAWVSKIKNQTAKSNRTICIIICYIYIILYKFLELLVMLCW